MPLKTKILTVPERYQPKLREHNFKHAESWKEKIDVLGRDEKGRIKPLVPCSCEPPGVGNGPDPECRAHGKG